MQIRRGEEEQGSEREWHQVWRRGDECVVEHLDEGLGYGSEEDEDSGAKEVEAELQVARAGRVGEEWRDHVVDGCDENDEFA